MLAAAFIAVSAGSTFVSSSSSSVIDGRASLVSSSSSSVIDGRSRSSNRRPIERVQHRHRIGGRRLRQHRDFFVVVDGAGRVLVLGRRRHARERQRLDRDAEQRRSALPRRYADGPGRSCGGGVCDAASEVTSSVASTVTSSDGSTLMSCPSSFCSFVICSGSRSFAVPLAANPEGGLVVISPTSLLDRQGS